MKTYIEQAVENKLQAIKEKENIFQIGRVRKITRYMLEVSGLEKVGFFEKVYIGDKGEGYIEKIGTNMVIVAVTRIYAPIQVGDEVIASGEEFMTYFSPESMGCIVDMFGMDQLTGKKFNDLIALPIESEAIPIMDRSAVCRPLHTGLTGIDMLYPIGRGQRQLIIGDKKTGKTQIGLDAIVNQRTEEMICIYIAIGKTKKEVKEVYAQLRDKDAMAYTLIVAAFNDECAPVMRNTVYAGVAYAEHYLREGKDVLVIIDDLKRHADVYREVSLLSGKVPGRDAYPPDIFYAHASVLEKGCQHKNGGSITILPICETKGGDITDYISTNIISITDGQIVLSSKKFEQGHKPAIDYGLSVSRLGGAVQTREIKETGAPIRNELLSYLEQKEIFELANMDEMGEELKEKMRRGHIIEEKLKQYKFNPKTTKEMIDDFKVLNGGDE
ncbi:MAG: hypothetical protein R3Y58_10645 [Eubacteriales bacterium]